MNYKALCEFNGQKFYGWQKQKRQNTVQEEIEKALLTLLDCHVPVTGCGRTDRGVSARDYVFNFKSEKPIADKQKFLKSLNALTDDSLHIKSMTAVGSDFHARFSCKSREYRYYLYNGISPLHRPFYYEYKRPVDAQTIKHEMDSLVGCRDLSSFCRKQSLKKDNNVHMIRADMMKRGREYVFIFKADRFLHNMIRLIMGTLLDISDGYDMTMEQIINRKDVKYAGRTAPPEGLVFYKAYY